LRQAYDYWQDQPGNCPTLRFAPARAGTRRGRGYRGARPFPRPEFSYRPIKVVPPSPSSQDATLSDGAIPQTQRPEFLVPRSHMPQRRSPGPSDRSRPLRWRLPASGRTSAEGCQNAADPQQASTANEIGHGLSRPHPSPALATAARAATLQSSDSRPRAQDSEARPQTLPERVHPARQAHRPLGPGTAGRPPQTATAATTNIQRNRRAPSLTAAAATAEHTHGAGTQVPGVESRPVSRLSGVKSQPVSPSPAQLAPHIVRNSHRQPPPVGQPSGGLALFMLTLHVVGKATF